MPNIGPLELGIVLVIALLVLGPKRLPDFGRSVGRGMREFKGALTGKDRDEGDDSPSAGAGMNRGRPEAPVSLRDSSATDVPGSGVEPGAQ